MKFCHGDEMSTEDEKVNLNVLGKQGKQVNIQLREHESDKI